VFPEQRTAAKAQLFKKKEFGNSTNHSSATGPRQRGHALSAQIICAFARDVQTLRTRRTTASWERRRHVSARKHKYDAGSSRDSDSRVQCVAYARLRFHSLDASLKLSTHQTLRCRKHGPGTLGQWRKGLVRHHHRLRDRCLAGCCAGG
jgi:hypothetical protein